VITRLWQASEERFSALLQFLVLVDHDLVHKFFEDEQLRKSTNAATVYSEVTSQNYVYELVPLRLYPMQVA